MPNFRSLAQRVFGKKRVEPVSCRPAIELLEPRQMLSTTLALTDIHLTGAVRAVTSVTLTFNEPLDPTAAADLQTYQIGKHVPASSSDDNGFNLGQLFGFLAQPKPRLLKQGRIQFTSAVYDDTNYTVTLTPVRAWNALAYFRYLRVYGAGQYALTDALGNALNGGGNTYVHWFPHIGKQISYRDSDGDIVHLKLKGKGQIVMFLQTNADHAPLIFILNGTSSSVLSGSVRQAPTGDGAAIIPELQGVSTIQATILTNPVFDVLTTEP